MGRIREYRQKASRKSSLYITSKMEMYLQHVPRHLTTTTAGIVGQLGLQAHSQTGHFFT